MTETNDGENPRHPPYKYRPGIISIVVHFITNYSSFKIVDTENIAGTGRSNRGPLNDAGIYCNSWAYAVLYLGAVSPTSKGADKPIVQVFTRYFHRQWLNLLNEPPSVIAYWQALYKHYKSPHSYSPISGAIIIKD